jgi:hypothetical protein
MANRKLEGTRRTRRDSTKSSIQLKCQRATRGAARKAAKTLQGKSRAPVGSSGWWKNNPQPWKNHPDADGIDKTFGDLFFGTSVGD